MSRTIDIAQPDLTILQQVLREHLPQDASAWVFGSRVTGAARRYSDVDLAIKHHAPLDPDMLAALRDALSESDLTIKVDVIDLHQLEPAFRHHVEVQMVRLPLSTDG